MTVWIYVARKSATRTISRSFATIEAAEAWFEENDPDGVAFEYDVVGEEYARGFSNSKVSAARATALAYNVIEKRLPTDAARKRRRHGGASSCKVQAASEKLVRIGSDEKAGSFP